LFLIESPRGVIIAAAMNRRGLSLRTVKCRLTLLCPHLWDDGPTIDDPQCAIDNRGYAPQPKP
jgi:hypothetical protein